jgi:hypothetical protein
MMGGVKRRLAGFGDARHITTLDNADARHSSRTDQCHARASERHRASGFINPFSSRGAKTMLRIARSASVIDRGALASRRDDEKPCVLSMFSAA